MAGTGTRMTWFCPYCWAEVLPETEVCPRCGGDLRRHVDLAEGLVLALRSPDALTRRRAAYLLGRMRAEAAVAALMKALEEDDPYVATEALEALHAIGAPQARQAVDAAIRHRYARVRRRARELLGNGGADPSGKIHVADSPPRPAGS